MPRILITGADSFVGRSIIESSRFREVEEISLFENKPEDIDFRKFDIVIHLVAIVHQSKGIPESEYYKINRDLCLQVAECAKKAGIKQFIFLSSVKVYGKYKSEPWNEYSLCFPNDSYGKSKYEAELNLIKMETPEFVVSIVRTPLVYGEGVKANMLSILRLVDKCPVLPLGSIKNKRSFTSADNLVAFIDRIIEKKASGVFIAMDEEPLSTTELVNYISKFLNRKVLLFKMPPIIIRLGTYLSPTIFDRLFGSFEMENSITLKRLDFRAPFTTEEVMKKMVVTYNKNKKKN